MRCPVCDQIAPRGANFCFACGTSLARICPRCQAGQSPDARLCPECGGRLPIGPGETPGEIPEDATEAPPESPPVVETRDDPDLLRDERGDLEELEALEAERRRESRRRLATAAGLLLLILAALGGMAFWMRSPGRAPSLERAAGRTPEASRPEGLPSVPAAPSPTAPRAAAPGPEPAPPPERRAPDPPEPRTAATAEPSTSEPPPSLPEPARRLAVETPERRAPEPPERRGAVRPEARAETRRAPSRPAEPERRTLDLPVPRVPIERESPAALPSRARGDVRIDVAAERSGGGITVYTVRLRERDGSPVTDAAVTIRGRRRTDGELVEAGLDPASEAGVYRAALRSSDVTSARLRVASAGRIQDLPLPE